MIFRRAVEHTGQATYRPTWNLEIDITLRCNMACPNCNRFCNMQELGIEYVDSDMTLEQVNRAVNQLETIAPECPDRIAVMGGEPLLHPDVTKICKLISERLLESGHVNTGLIITNGTLEIPRELSETEFQIVNYGSPEIAQAKHRCVFVAPKDRGETGRPCSNLVNCGTNLSAYGYTPCSSAAATVRLFSLDQFVLFKPPKSLDDFSGDITDLCTLCSLGSDNVLFQREHGRPISNSYRIAIDRAREHGLKLRRF